MADFIFPSVNDLYGSGSAGDGINIKEANFSNIIRRASFEIDRFIDYGSPGTGSGFEFQAPATKAIIQGYYVEADAQNFNVTASSTNYIYLQLTRDGSNNVTGATWSHNTTATPPTDALMYAVAVADGSAITTTYVGMYPSGTGEAFTATNGPYLSDSILSGLKINLYSVLTDSTWETVGPSYSGASNTWSILDNVPLYAKAILLDIFISIAGSTNASTYTAYVYGRANGSSRGTTESKIAQAGFTNRSGSSEKDDDNNSSVILPLDNKNIFELQRVVSGTTPTVSIDAFFRGFYL